MPITGLSDLLVSSRKQLISVLSFCHQSEAQGLWGMPDSLGGDWPCLIKEGAPKQGASMRLSKGPNLLLTQETQVQDTNACTAAPRPERA